MAGKLYAFPSSFQAHKIQIAAAFSGKNLEVADFVVGETDKSAEFLKKFPLGKVPAFEGNGVTLFETNAIAYYVGNDETRGGANEAEVLQWIGVADNEILPSACTWVYPTLGIMQYNKGATEKAKEDIKKVLAMLNNHLLSHTFLVGERISQADISLACTLLMLYVGVFDPDFRSSFPNVNRWFTTLINQPQFKSVLGDVKLCTKMAQFDSKKYNEVCGKSAKKEQTSKAKPKAQEKKPKKEEVGGGEEAAPPAAPAKKVDPWANSPEPTFDMELWKRTYSNSSGDESFQYFLDKFPKENYSIWHCKYKYNDELSMKFMSMNLINGMLQRLEKLRKNAFGVMLLLGDDTGKKFEIEGIWVWLGHELAFERSPDWQIDYEYFSWDKLDIDDQCTKDSINKFFRFEGDFHGLKCVDGSEYK